MKKTLKIVLLTVVILSMALLFAGCDMKYGSPDSLNIGDGSVGYRFLIGGQVFLLGLGMVFVVLVCLILLITLIKYVSKIQLSKKEADTAKSAEEAPQQPAVFEEDEEIVAAITAAIAAMYDAERGESAPKLKFRVRSIREIK